MLTWTAGRIPSSIGQLVGLQILDLSDNSLTGSFCVRCRWTSVVRWCEVVHGAVVVGVTVDIVLVVRTGTKRGGSRGCSGCSSLVSVGLSYCLAFDSTVDGLLACDSMACNLLSFSLWWWSGVVSAAMATLVVVS